MIIRDDFFESNIFWRLFWQFSHIDTNATFKKTKMVDRTKFVWLIDLIDSRENSAGFLTARIRNYIQVSAGRKYSRPFRFAFGHTKRTTKTNIINVILKLAPAAVRAFTRSRYKYIFGRRWHLYDCMIMYCSGPVRSEVRMQPHYVRVAKMWEWVQPVANWHCTNAWRCVDSLNK